MCVLKAMYIVLVKQAMRMVLNMGMLKARCIAYNFLSVFKAIWTVQNIFVL